MSSIMGMFCPFLKKAVDYNGIVDGTNARSIHDVLYVVAVIIYRFSQMRSSCLNF